MDAAELFRRYNAGERVFADINLCCADLHRARLRGACLRGAYLRWINLRGAIVAEEQLAQAATLKGPVLPDGRVHE